MLLELVSQCSSNRLSHEATYNLYIMQNNPLVFCEVNAVANVKVTKLKHI